MSEREYEISKLITPVFIEESFTTPIFNEVTERELNKTAEWVKKQKIENEIIKSVCGFIEECIILNRKLSKEQSFNNSIAPLPGENIASDARMDIYHAVRGEVFANLREARDFLYFFMREFSTSEFARKQYDSENEKYCDFLYWFMMEWYGESDAVHNL